MLNKIGKCKKKQKLKDGTVIEDTQNYLNRGAFWKTDSPDRMTN